MSEKVDLIYSADRPVHPTNDAMPWGQGALEHIMTREEAFEVVARAKGKTPADWLSWMHLGSALHIAGASEAGLKAAQKACELHRTASTLMNVAVILESFGRFAEALKLSAEAILRDPTDQFAGLLWAQGHLRFGNWRTAWPAFETYCWGKIWEVGLEQYIPQWHDQPLHGKRILVLQGGGFGDNLMFMRWFRNLKEMGAHISYACPDVMVPLLEGHPWIDRLIPTHEGPETDELPEVDIRIGDYDYFVPIMGLAKRCGATVENTEMASALGPYIQSKQRLKYHGIKKPLVGVCWMGAEKLDPRRHRSLDKQQTIRLLTAGCPYVDWVNLQFGMDFPWHSDAWGQSLFMHTEIKNWSDTASVISQLDLVVTVDTGVMHLAGAMGKPTWAILPGLSDWKFLLNRDDSPFYPTLRLFRNEGIGLENALTSCIDALQEFSE